MNEKQKQAYITRLNELTEAFYSAKLGYPTKEHMLGISDKLIKLCSEILQNTNNPK